MTALAQAIGTENMTFEPFPWLLAYFRQIYTHRVDLTADGVQLFPLSAEQLLSEALHLAFSYDGLHWTALNRNQPIFTPGDNQRIRDPFIRRGRDGNFHLLATGGWAVTGMYYARSNDLIHWTDERTLPIMEQVPAARNVWAPEFIFDAQHNQYLVYWSSSRGKNGWDDSRIWYAHTLDFQTFSPPRVLFDPGYTVIDATIVPLSDACYMFFKDERFGHVHGEHRYIQVAAAPSLAGPYTCVTAAVTPSITEGPTVMRAPESGQWYLMYDHCMDNRYGVSVSEDLLSWRVVDDIEFPPNARHGSVFSVTERELAKLREHWGE